MKRTFNFLQLLHQAKMTAFNALVHRRINLPSAIGIETSTACNRRCHYCPQSVEAKKQQIVTPQIWWLFLHRLQEFKWRGAVALTKYNEFALVPNSERYIRNLREIGCRPIVFSNGDRPEVLLRWIKAGVFRIRITEHPPFRPQWIEDLRNLMEDYPAIVKVRRLRHLHNQAGRVDVGERMEVCHNAHGISVNVDGTVSMCCLDYNSENLVGDIRRQSLEEIWNSEAHRRVRNLVVRGIPATELCKSCLVPQPEPEAT